MHTYVSITGIKDLTLNAVTFEMLVSLTNFKYIACPVPPFTIAFALWLTRVNKFWSILFLMKQKSWFETAFKCNCDICGNHSNVYQIVDLTWMLEACRTRVTNINFLTSTVCSYFTRAFSQNIMSRFGHYVSSVLVHNHSMSHQITSDSLLGKHGSYCCGRSRLLHFCRRVHTPSP